MTQGALWRPLEGGGSLTETIYTFVNVFTVHMCDGHRKFRSVERSYDVGQSHVL